MSQYTTGVNFNSNSGFFEVSSVDSSGKVSTQNVNFSTLCMMFSLDSLNAQDEVFASQFAIAEEQVSQLTMINDCMQMLNKYSTQFENSDVDSITFEGDVPVNDIAYEQKMLDRGQIAAQYVPIAGDDGIWSEEEYKELYKTYAADINATYVEVDGKPTISKAGSDMEAWRTVYYPQLVESGLVQSSIDMDGTFTESELDTMMENLQSAQSAVSSQNEQQMLLTNDAANKRSTILQQAQTLLQAAQDARNAAAKT